MSTDDPAEKPEKCISQANYITALSHLYRGEMHRSQVWRLRLDTTTNWSIVATLGILTFSFNNPRYSSETLILGMYANLVFLFIEARRFRFFDVWRARVRMLEEHFFSPVLFGDRLDPQESWGPHVASDLRHPKFKITMMQAIRARLTRNFIYVFLFLLVAWVGRVIVLPIPESEGVLGLFTIGGVPGWVPIVLVIVLHLFLVGVILFTPRVKPPEVSYWPDPEHQGNEISTLDV